MHTDESNVPEEMLQALQPRPMYTDESVHLIREQRIITNIINWNKTPSRRRKNEGRRILQAHKKGRSAVQQCCINQREMTAAWGPCKRMTERKSASVPAGWRCRTGECRPSVPGVPACRNYNTGNLCQASAFMRRGGITDAPSDKHRLRRLRMLFLGRAYRKKQASGL